ncbi:hypothetical protein GF386_02325 [Candidatus Pacearchaeota archaeon]|nr:hypothetical protein [Candidatus Pacearchaeota archaeon]MBD3282994.1 hypothetical protein [Candidatus Pacearchaeota archaeon]
MKNKSPISARDIFLGVIFILISTLLLFTEYGRKLFIPFKDCPACLQFYYYLISYTFALAGIFLIIRALGIIKH